MEPKKKLPTLSTVGLILLNLAWLPRFGRFLQLGRFICLFRIAALLGWLLDVVGGVLWLLRTPTAELVPQEGPAHP